MISRPHWSQHNPGNKRWYCEQMAKAWRDERLEDLTEADRDRWLTDDERTEMRRLQMLKKDDTIDAMCLPEWVERRFAWPWKEA